MKSSQAKMSTSNGSPYAPGEYNEIPMVEPAPPKPVAPIRKPARWNPFAKQEKAQVSPSAQGDGSRFGSFKSKTPTIFEEAPPYSAESAYQETNPNPAAAHAMQQPQRQQGAQPAQSPQPTPQPRQSRGWRWPWSAK
jgi:hypothetical protein